jgi:hypothetical protein
MNNDELVDEMVRLLGGEIKSLLAESQASLLAVTGGCAARGEKGEMSPMNRIVH